jgi:hypothetical protein
MVRCAGESLLLDPPQPLVQGDVPGAGGSSTSPGWMPATTPCGHTGSGSAPAAGPA